MKTIKFSAVVAGMLSAGTLLLVVPGVSSAAGQDGLDIHGWRIDMDIHGWRIDHSSPAGRVAASSSPYVGTSLRVDPQEGLGFTDPRPGQGDFAYKPYVGTSLGTAADGELGSTDPRPGQSDY